MSVGVKHQDSQNSFLAFLNAPTSALDQFDVSIQDWKSSLGLELKICNQLGNHKSAVHKIISVLLLHAFMFIFRSHEFSKIFIFVFIFLVVSLLHSLAYQDSYSSSSSSLIEFWEDVSFSWLGGGPCVCVCDSSCML